MKKSKTSVKESQTDPDEVLPEYDFSKARPNKYAARYRKGDLVVTGDPDVAKVFSTAEDINQTLRALAKIIQTGRRRRSGNAPGR